jgi:hypothetical protein
MMCQSYFGVGLAVHGLASGMWSFTESHGLLWLPFMMAIVGALPMIGKWTTAFAYSEPDSHEPIWNLHRRDL